MTSSSAALKHRNLRASAPGAGSVATDADEDHTHSGRPQGVSRGLSPRVHNTVSYAGAALAFCATVITKRSSGGCAEVFASDAGPPASGPLTAREMAVVCWVLHFARRTAESAWLHRYSQPTVPCFDTVTEFLYYWCFAAWIAHSVVCSESRDGTASPSAFSSQQLAGAVLWAVAEAGNCYVHMQLARLRPSRAATTAE